MLLRVEDSSWQGVVRLRGAVTECLEEAATQVHVDLQRLDPDGASAFWLAALVSLRRLASARGCRLVLLAPPACLSAALARLHLEVDQPPGS